MAELLRSHHQGLDWPGDECSLASKGAGAGGDRPNGTLAGQTVENGRRNAPNAYLLASCAGKRAMCGTASCKIMHTRALHQTAPANQGPATPSDNRRLRRSRRGKGETACKAIKACATLARGWPPPVCRWTAAPCRASPGVIHASPIRRSRRWPGSARRYRMVCCCGCRPDRHDLQWQSDTPREHT